jgi:hypothetical protein
MTPQHVALDAKCSIHRHLCCARSRQYVRGSIVEARPTAWRRARPSFDLVRGGSSVKPAQIEARGQNSRASWPRYSPKEIAHWVSPIGFFEETDGISLQTGRIPIAIAAMGADFVQFFRL